MGIARGNESFQDTLEVFANQWYEYGREWLAGQVRGKGGGGCDRGCELCVQGCW